MQGRDNLLRNLLRRFSIAVYDQLGLAIVRQPPGVKRAKRFDIDCQGTRVLGQSFADGPAALQQFFDVKLQKDYVSAEGVQEIGILRFDEGSAAERKDGRSGGLLKDRAQSVSLNVAEVRLSMERKDFVNAQLRAALDLAIEVEEAPAETGREHATDGTLAGCHEAAEGDDGRRRLGLAGLRGGVHRKPRT